jgi:repressor of nif and glnA expression
VLETGQDIVNQTVRVNNRMLNVTIFSIDDHHVVGATLLDVTQTEMRREQVVEKASMVIRNTLSTVQEIAFRLGKNAAESEVTLNSIIEAFSPPTLDSQDGSRSNEGLPGDLPKRLGSDRHEGK